MLDTIAAPVQIRAKANRIEHGIRRLLDRGIVHPAEQQLLSMEGRSVRTVGRRCRPKRDQGFITGTQLAVAEEPRNDPPLIFKYRVRQTPKPVWDRAEGLRNLIENFLSCHAIFLRV